MSPYKIFVSQNVPKALVGKYNISQAANNFCANINNLKYFDEHIAIPPGNIGNDFKSFFDEESGIYYKVVRLFKHHGFGKILNILLDNIWLYSYILKYKNANVWFYNVWTGNLCSYIFLRFLSPCKVFVLLADYNPKRYKSIVGKLLLWAIKCSNGVVSLSARCSEVNKNFCSIAGIIPSDKIQLANETIEKNSFLLSGTLNANTGLPLALEVFKDIPEAKLYISGSVDSSCKDLIDKYTYQYKNIIYKGYFHTYEDYLHFLKSIHYVLSLRNPSSMVNHYNFPSKILEAISLNKIVISTMDYPELNGVKYFKAPFEKKYLREYLISICMSNNEMYRNGCYNDYNTLTNLFSEKAWIAAFKRIEDDK